MNKFKKLDDREKLIIVILTIAVLAFLGYTLGYVPLTEKTAEIRNRIQSEATNDTNVENLKTQENMAKQAYDGINNRVTEIVNSNSTNTVNRQDFLIFLGEKTNEYGVDLRRFQDFGVIQKDGTWRAKFELDFYGLMGDIQSIINDIESLGIVYNVSGISFRRSEDEEWLKRTIDTTNKLPFAPNVESKEDSIQKTPQEIIEEARVAAELEAKKALEEALAAQQPSTQETTESTPKNASEWLDSILTGEKGGVLTPSKPTPNPILPSVPTDVEPTAPPEPLLIPRSNKLDKLKLHLTIEFIMFKDPSQNYSFNEIPASDEGYLFQVDKNGTLISRRELMMLFNSDRNFVVNEQARVKRELDELSALGQKSFKLSEYFTLLTDYLSSGVSEDTQELFTIDFNDSNYSSGYIEMLVSGVDNLSYTAYVQLTSGEVILRGITGIPLKVNYGKHTGDFDINIVVEYNGIVEKYTSKYTVK